MDNDRGQGRISFTVPAGAGAYAPEELFMKALEKTSPVGSFDRVGSLQILIENLIAAAVVEVWILKVGGDANLPGNWIYSGQSRNAAGIAGDAIELGGTNAVKLRAKSGGNAGAMAVSAYWT